MSVQERKKAWSPVKFSYRPENLNMPECEEKVEPEGLKKFHTGSSYYGSWDKNEMNGEGVYTFPNGVQYKGNMENGVFHLDGTLIYPNGGMMKGKWLHGVMVESTYVFSDGLEYKPRKWKYCQMPDRRFYSEIINGIPPAGRTKLANDHPAREIPEGCYDTMEGFYNPDTHLLYHPISGEVIRSVPGKEEKWIKSHCRKGWTENVPFKPMLNESYYPYIQSHRTYKNHWKDYLRPDAYKIMVDALLDSVKLKERTKKTKEDSSESMEYDACTRPKSRVSVKNVLKLRIREDEQNKKQQSGLGEVGSQQGIFEMQNLFDSYMPPTKLGWDLPSDFGT